MDLLEAQIDKLIRTENEDISAVAGDVKVLKNEFSGLKIKIKQCIPAWS